MTPWILAAKLSVTALAGAELAAAPVETPTAETPAPDPDPSASATPAIAPKRPPRTSSEEPRAPATTSREPKPAAPEADLGLWPSDASRLPRLEPSGVVRGRSPGRVPMIGWSEGLGEPRFVDRTHRVPWVARPANFGDTMRPGERFKFDVYFGGNPTGIAEAAVVARESGPNGTPDRLRLEGSARTSGVAALLTTIVYDMAAILDAETGAPLMTGAITKREGMATTYKRRETVATFFGRGFVEITDDRDGKTSTARRRLPIDTFDPLSVMAWVRSLDLEPGAKAKAYALDGNTLLRVDITARGPTRTDSMPPLAAALGITQEQVVAYDGVITRVDRFGAAMPGKKSYKMRVWVSSEGRRIPLMIESDLWLGVVRLILTQYDPPHESATARPSAADRPAPRG